MTKKIIPFIRKQQLLYNALLIGHSLLLTSRFGFFYLIFRVLPIKKNKIVVCSYYGKGFGDNAKYIAQELLLQANSYDIVWQLSPRFAANHGLPSGIRTVKYDSIREIYELCTAKIWIDNSRKTHPIFKRKEQFYIQTWHGSLGVKMVEKDAIETLNKAYIRAAKADSQMANLFVSNGKHIRGLYRNSFWYDGEILEAGSPRNDLFFKDTSALRLKIATYFGISAETKILLYAPTFRQNRAGELYDLNFLKCIDALQLRWPSNWVILMRLHPNRAKEVLKIANPDKVLNATLYDDMQELLAVADVLITDYSSSVFDYALRRKPAFLFTPDEADYVQERGFYFDINTLPFPKANSNEHLCSLIASFNELEYCNKLDTFYRQQEVMEDGNASRRLVERINREINK